MELRADARQLTMAPAGNADRVKAALERWFDDAWLRGEVARGLEVFRPNVVVHCASGDLDGISALGAVLVEMAALEGLDGKLETEADGELLVARYVLRGRHVRPLFGADPSGEVIELHGIATLRTVEDGVAELWHTATVRRPEARLLGAARAGLEEKPWARRWALTLRETLVAELAMLGYGDKQIAAELELATTSVSKYLRTILRKAGVPSRTALAERAGVVRLG